MQCCIPWQPLYKPGSQRLQVWLCRRPLLLLGPMLRIRLEQSFLRSRFKCWDWTLAVDTTLPCNRLWQPGWVAAPYFSYIFNTPCHRCCHLAKLPWWVSQQHFKDRDNTSGGRNATDVTIHCIQHHLFFWLPDNHGWGRDDLPGKDLWLHPAKQYHKHQQCHQPVLQNRRPWHSQWLECQLERGDTRCVTKLNLIS